MRLRTSLSFPSWYMNVYDINAVLDDKDEGGVDGYDIYDDGGDDDDDDDDDVDGEEGLY